MKKITISFLFYLLTNIGYSQLYVPNAFSPNGDGLNDYWQVTVGDSTINNYLCQVTNRYGKVIWQSFDPTDKWLGGDGYYSPNGVYQYMITYNNKKYFGNLTIIR